MLSRRSQEVLEKTLNKCLCTDKKTTAKSLLRERTGKTSQLAERILK